MSSLVPHVTALNRSSHVAVPGARVGAGRGLGPVGRRGPGASPGCWCMCGPCWAAAVSGLMFPGEFAWYPPLN